jgi:hypothetical protein
VSTKAPTKPPTSLNPAPTEAPFQCYDTCQRGALSWKAKDRATSFETAKAWCSGYGYAVPWTNHPYDAKVHVWATPRPYDQLTISWQLAISSKGNGAAFQYGSNWWSTLKEMDDGAGNQVAAAYYSSIVTQMKVEMNGKSHISTMSHGKTLREIITAPTNSYCTDSKGWLNTKTNPWALTRDGHETYVCTKMCCNVNYQNHACSNKQKLGFTMSEQAPCSHPGTGEGLGLIETCQHNNDNLASGRLQWQVRRTAPMTQKCTFGPLPSARLPPPRRSVEAFVAMLAS